MSKEERTAPAAGNHSEQMDQMLDSMTGKKDQNESQFHKLGEVVENDDDTGLVEIESLCMNCHENVCHIYM
jgi:zinc finger protein